MTDHTPLEAVRVAFGFDRPEGVGGEQNGANGGGSPFARVRGGSDSSGASTGRTGLLPSHISPDDVRLISEIVIPAAMEEQKREFVRLFTEVADLRRRLNEVLHEMNCDQPEHERYARIARLVTGIGFDRQEGVGEGQNAPPRWVSDDAGISRPSGDADASTGRTTAELVAEARDWTAFCREARYGSPSSADLIDDLADALEAVSDAAS